MRQLAFHYHLSITFEDPIRHHRFTLRCFPQSDARQQVTEVRRFLFPREFLSESRDAFGNLTIYGCAEQPHRQFEADVCGRAAVGLAPCLPRGDASREGLFRYPTPLTAPDDALRAFYAGLGLAGRDPYDACLALMEAVGRHLTYTPGSTTIQTTAAQAFALGKGVCQDYAHIMLALLRLHGIPARYVVGMLEGEGQSHAWVEAGLPGGWYAFDPTNQLVVSDRHVKLSHGRDYEDCSINRGTFLGRTLQTQRISVIVEAVEDGDR